MGSLSGIVTFRSAENLREVARRVPADRLLVETDCPYLAPVPHRGKTNEPAFVRHVAECVAEVRGESVEAVAERTPDAIFREPLHPLLGLQPFQAREVAFRLGFRGKQVGQAVRVMTNLARLFLASDASLAEMKRAGEVTVLEQTRIDVPAAGTKAIFVADPDGTLIELVQQAGD